MAALQLSAESSILSPNSCLGNIPHKCEICSQRFVNQNGLEDHIRTHYGDAYPESLTQKA